MSGSERGTVRLKWSQSTAVYLVAVWVGVNLGVLSLLALSFSGRVIAILVGIPLGIVAVALAFRRFELFLVGLIAIRPELDLLHQGSGGLTSPSTIVGAVFIVASLYWLYLRWSEGSMRRPSPATLALLMMTGIFGASVLVSGTPIWSASNELKVVAGVLMFVVLEQLLPGRRDLAVRLVWAALVSGIVPMTMGVYQAVTARHLSAYADVSRVQGTFVHPNPFATYLVILLCLAVGLLSTVRARQRLALSQRLGLAVYTAAVGGVLVLTYARTAWAAAVLGLAYLVSRRRAWVLPILVAALLVTVVAVPSVGSRLTDLRAAKPIPGVPSNSLSWRVSYWRTLIPIGNRNPMTGIGLEMVQRVMPIGLPPHNGFVQAYVETGILGLGALLVAVAGMWVTLRRRVREARTTLELTLGYVGVAIGLGLGLQLFTENLLTQTMVYWYFAVACGFGFLERTVDPVEAVPVTIRGG